MLFDAVEVTDDDFLQRRAPGQGRAGSGGTEERAEAWFPLMVAAANLGVAEAARDYTVQYARQRQPTGAPHPIAQIPHVREQIGRMQSALVAARVMLLTAAEDWELDPRPAAPTASQIPIAKRLATNTAVEVTDIAMRVVGGVALHRSEPLERYFRDVRSGLVNPPIEARALEQAAAPLLDPRPD
jgi:alkylation response protein AidB-like acyl-CoA dehydrogenase